MLISSLFLAFTPKMGCSTSVLVILPMLLRDHLVDCALGDLDKAFQVGGGEASQIRGRVAREQLGKEYACVVDERVD
jgi:hypothetical protein